MDIKIAEDWKTQLQEEFDKPYFFELMSFLGTEYQNHSCFPEVSQIFTAFNLCSFEDVKVVIIGQDPYHGLGQADGLCFSVKEGLAHPPSLKNIFKEITADIGIKAPLSGDLQHWAKQGVLLLNSILTVRQNQAGSHKNRGWEKFTDAVIRMISDKKQDVVFLLWGSYAKNKGKKINKNKHKILTSGHPSPLSANRGYWFGNKHFSITNTCLKSTCQNVIKW